jgi:hypothetical protein
LLVAIQSNRSGRVRLSQYCSHFLFDKDWPILAEAPQRLSATLQSHATVLQITKGCDAFAGSVFPRFPWDVSQTKIQTIIGDQSLRHLNGGMHRPFDQVAN